MRFTEQNWNKFFDGSNKTTTIRMKPSKEGVHNCYSGSYVKPKFLGTVTIHRVQEKLFSQLDGQDAKDDGFKSLEELNTELIRLNKYIPLNKVVYKHYIRDVKRAP